jgi:hypothetical protein
MKWSEGGLAAATYRLRMGENCVVVIKGKYGKWQKNNGG